MTTVQTKTPLDIHAIVQKLIGPIEPVGVTEIDDERFENLQEMIELAGEILQDLCSVVPQAEHFEASRKRAGKYATASLVQFGRDLSNLDRKFVRGDLVRVVRSLNPTILGCTYSLICPTEEDPKQWKMVSMSEIQTVATIIYFHEDNLVLVNHDE